MALLGPLDFGYIDAGQICLILHIPLLLLPPPTVALAMPSLSLSLSCLALDAPWMPLGGPLDDPWRTLGYPWITHHTHMIDITLSALLRWDMVGTHLDMGIELGKVSRGLELWGKQWASVVHVWTDVWTDVCW